MEAFLAIFHYLSIFVLFALLVGEFVLLRIEVSGSSLKLISRLDVLYGVFAGIVILSGVLRVFFGEIPAAFWASNVKFWIKMGLYLVVGVLSVPPTLQYMRWTRTYVQEGRLPTPGEWKKTSLWVHIQMGLFLLIPVFAVLMRDK